MSLSTGQLRVDCLETMARSVGHELRTSLLAIKSGIGGVKDYVPTLVEVYEMAIKHGLDVPEIQPKYLDMLTKALDLTERAASCASTYVNMFITNMTRVDAEKMSLHVSSIKVCLQDAAEQFPYKSDEQKSLLVNSIHEIGDFSLMGNRELVVNLLLNLFKNAIFHVQDAGKGDIKVWTKIDTDTNYLYIRDTGNGIAEEELAFIFDPFYSSQKNNIGMGLFFCRELMRVLKGDITCASRKGCFTEFSISFPSL